MRNSPQIIYILSYNMILVNCPITIRYYFIWIKFTEYQSFKKIKYLVFAELSKWDSNWYLSVIF